MGIPHSDVELYLVRSANDNDLAQHDIRGNAAPLPHRATLDELFPHPPGRDDYILIVNGMMLLFHLVLYLLKYGSRLFGARGRAAGASHLPTGRGNW